MRGCKFERALRACDDGREHFHRSFSSLLSAGLGCRVNNIPVLTLGKRKAAYIASVKFDGGIRSKVRTLGREPRGITGEYNHPGAEAQSLIDVAKTLDEAAAEESGSPGQKNTLAAYFFPQWSCVLQNQFQVLPGKRVRWAHQSSKPEMIISDPNSSQGPAAPFIPSSDLGASRPKRKPTAFA
jgi:hypothetical protein